LFIAIADMLTDFIVLNLIHIFTLLLVLINNIRLCSCRYYGKYSTVPGKVVYSLPIDSIHSSSKSPCFRVKLNQHLIRSLGDMKAWIVAY
jgi:hypothetical protein